MGTNKNVLRVVSAIALIIGGGALLLWAINGLFGTSSALAIVSVVLLSLFLYILGASLLGGALKKDNMHHHYGGGNNGVMFAFLLIGGGLLLLGFNTGLLHIEWRRFFFSWQMVLFIVGVIHLCRRNLIAGTLITIAGLFFLFEKTSVVFPYDIRLGEFVATFWPVFIIFFGVAILLGIVFRSGRFGKGHRRNRWKDHYAPNEQENNDGKINYQFSFSGTEQVVLDPIFKGGNIDVTFGGMELDLRRTSLAEGDTFLYVKSTFGGVKISVPDNWDIEIRSKAVLGGVTDSRDKNVEKDRTRKLIIIADSTLGGIEIK